MSPPDLAAITPGADPAGRLRRALRSPATAIAFAVLVVMLVGVGVLGPWLGRHAPDAIALADRLQPPGMQHWLGTDELGRDLFSRIAHGTVLSVGSAVLVALATATLGMLIGGTAGLLGGWVDTIVMRMMDVLLSLPALLLAIALAAALGPGLGNALIALVVVRIPVYARLSRNQALALRRRAFVEAAVVLGAGRLHLLRAHLVPNMLPVVVVQAFADVAGLILATAALGFIGLGAQPPTPEWGALVASSRYFIAEAWWYALFPGLAIFVTAIAFNLVGDALRDWLDPRD